ncbi:hypothetical protein MKX03_026183 [Papaver bracteatum]|nr:hypothetical protein MKX03_026183 [Papaver bracteatum]
MFEQLSHSPWISLIVISSGMKCSANSESTCDFATHFFCHYCALCQEVGELQRRSPHPGFNARPVFVMMLPSEKMMGRSGNAWNMWPFWCTNQVCFL